MDKTKIALDTSLCSRECGMDEKQYAGVWNGEVCLCGDSITGMKKLSSTSCTAEQNKAVTVYNSAINVKIPDLEIDVSPASKSFFRFCFISVVSD